VLGATSVICVIAEVEDHKATAKRTNAVVALFSETPSIEIDLLTFPA